MAQFDVQKLSSGQGLIIDCQSDLLAQLNTRLVVPLILRKNAPAPAARLNPIFDIAGREHVMVTQFAAAVRVSELGAIVESLRYRSLDIVGALDVLITGV